MPNYKLRTYTKHWTPGQIVDDDMLKRAGVDLEFWKQHGVVEETNDNPNGPQTVGGQPAPALLPLPEGDEDRPLSDLENKARIEARLRDEALARGPLSHEENGRIAAEVADEGNNPKRRRGKRSDTSGSRSADPYRGRMNEGDDGHLGTAGNPPHYNTKQPPEAGNPHPDFNAPPGTPLPGSAGAPLPPPGKQVPNPHQPVAPTGPANPQTRPIPPQPTPPGVQRPPGATPTAPPK